MTTAAWHQVSNVGDIESPSLLLYTERIDQNIDRMLQIAGSAERLRPHVKTHKLAEVIHKHLAKGITKFKCATIAEAEMVASCGAPDVLLAYQPVGPNARRFCDLIRAFPKTQFSTIVDDEAAARNLSQVAQQQNVAVNVFLDINCGQHRTGIAPGPEALKLYKSLCSLPAVKP